jgi:hypothetical protein
MTLYFCKPQQVVVATHGDDQVYLDPIKTYGLMCYVLVDIAGRTPEWNYQEDPNDPTLKYPVSIKYPTVTPVIHAASVKLECRRRITIKVSDQAQRNITTHINDIQMARMAQAPARLPTPAEQADMDTAAAIWDWIGRPTGMQAASDALIAATDDEFYEDTKWPAWNSGWDAFVARF